jgi:hypothetical protein
MTCLAWGGNQIWNVSRQILEFQGNSYYLKVSPVQSSLKISYLSKYDDCLSELNRNFLLHPSCPEISAQENRSSCPARASRIICSGNLSVGEEDGGRPRIF